MNVSRVLFMTAFSALAFHAEGRGDDGTSLLRLVDAGTIAVISDGDFLASTYGSGRLAPRDAKYRDVLSVFSRDGSRVKLGQVEVSNSVTSPPEVLALTADGRTAFVVERLGQRKEGIEIASELPPGRRLSAIDLTDKTAPRIAASIDVSVFPEAARVSPDGRLSQSSPTRLRPACCSLWLTNVEGSVQ